MPVTISPHSEERVDAPENSTGGKGKGGEEEFQPRVKKVYNGVSRMERQEQDVKKKRSEDPWFISLIKSEKMGTSH